MFGKVCCNFSYWSFFAFCLGSSGFLETAVYENSAAVKLWQVSPGAGKAWAFQLY